MAAIRIPILSTLTRLQRILLAAVALVIVLFIVAVGVGGGSSEGSPEDGQQGFVGWLGGLFGGSAAVDHHAITTGCLAPAGSSDTPPAPAAPTPGPTPTAKPSGPAPSLPPGGGSSTSAPPSPVASPSATHELRLRFTDTCTVHVAAGDDDVRNLELQAQAAITVKSRVPNQDTTGVREVAAGDKLSVAVDGKATDILLTCHTDDPCVVVVP
jgi:hypothetical protein